MKAYWRIDSFRGGSSFSTWLTSIVVNACLMVLRRRRLRPMVSLDEPREGGNPWMESLPDSSVDVEAAYLQHELGVLLARAVSGLNPRLRSILEDQQRSDEPLSDVARRQGISLPAAKSRVMRARVALKGAFVAAGAL